jgi:hypothetical protein
MAALIRELAKFSEDAIHGAMNQVFQEDQANERQEFEDKLLALTNMLEKPPKRRKIKKTDGVVSYNTKIFKDVILKKIRQKMDEYDQHLLNSDEILKFNVNTAFVECTDIPNLQALKEVHETVIEQEKTMTGQQLIAAYHRGLVYLNARNFMPQGAIVKIFYAREFHINYATAQRYLLFHMLIRTYPKLIFCDLSFTQLSKHHNRILLHMESDLQLADRLKSSALLIVEYRDLDITPIAIEGIPTTVDLQPISVDPDYIHDDEMNSELLLDEDDIEQFLSSSL